MFYPKNYILFFSILLFVFAGLSVEGQQVLIRGIVRDSNSHQILEDATNTLYHLPVIKTLEIKRSGNGFEFSRLDSGNYLVITSYQGYLTDSTTFLIKTNDSLSIQLDIFLKENVGSLLEVVVRASIPPAIVKNDTIAFNAGAYPSPPNSTVEDMLRKLPGIEIDKDGNITMQGQKVDKITINGKDFFLNDLRNASQTLPADLIAQIEVFDTKSQKSKLTGIHEKSSSKTINLKLKKNRQKGEFGKLYAGLGNSGNFSAGGNATRLDGSQMIFLNGNANNINNQFTGSEHQNGPGSGSQVVNNVQLNYRDSLFNKLSATVNAGRTYDNSLITQLLNRQTVLTDSSIVQKSASNAKNISTNYTVNGQFEFALDSLTQINLNSYYTNQKMKNHASDSVAIWTVKPGSNFLSSLGKTDNMLAGNSGTLFNSLDFRRKFLKKGRQVYFNFFQNSTNQNQPATLMSVLKNLDSTGIALSNTIVNQQSSQKIYNSAYNLNASYTEPIGKRHVLDFSYYYNRSNGHSDKESFNYDSSDGKYDLPDSLTTNHFLNHNSVQGISVGYNTTEGKYQFQVGLTGQLSQLDNLNLVNNIDLHQQTYNWLPRASLYWDMGKGKNMFINYTGINIAPTIEQLQPVPDLTNPYLIKTGNPDLKQQLTHNLSARYAAFNSRSFQNWQIIISGDYSQNQITSASNALAGGVQELEYINVKGVYHGSGYLTYGFPLGGQKNGNASFNLHGQFGHDISLVNGVKNITRNTGIGGEASINFHVRDQIFIDSRINLNQTNSNYSLPGSPSTQTLNENYVLNVTYRLPWELTVASYYNLQITGSQSNLPSHAVSLWNASINKSLFQNHCEFRISAYDLLNSANSFTQTVGVNYVQTQSTNLPGRILLCSIIYRFRKFEI